MRLVWEAFAEVALTVGVLTVTWWLARRGPEPDLTTFGDVDE